MSEKKSVACGQVWRLVDDKKYNGIGTVGDLIIVLSRALDYWQIGCFWSSGGERGGAREHQLLELEIHQIADYVGELEQPKEIDFKFILDAQIFDELKRRYPCMVFIAKKINVDGKGGEVTVDSYNGGFNECAGLALEASLKQTYTKLATGRPTLDF